MNQVLQLRNEERSLKRLPAFTLSAIKSVHCNFVISMAKKFKIKPDEEKHIGQHVKVRLTQADRLEIENRAANYGISLSEYIRRTALGRPIRKSNVHELIIELRAIANLQRECFKSDRRNEHHYQDILQTVVNAITAIPLRITSHQNQTKE